MWVRLPSPAYARVAQLVERDLAKVEAAGSSPVSRFFYFHQYIDCADDFLFSTSKKSRPQFLDFMRNTAAWVFNSCFVYICDLWDKTPVHVPVLSLAP